MIAPGADLRNPLAGPSAQSARLSIALAASLVLHVVALSTQILPERPPHVGNASQPIEVVLVNAKSPEASLKPDALAQVNLAGGGNTGADAQLKSPLPASPESRVAERTAALANQVEKLEARARTLMSQIESRPELPQPRPAPTAAELRQQAQEMAREETRELAQLQARIAQQQSEYQKGPRRAYVGANVKEYVFARYVEDWVAKVERIGNLNYPEAARRNKIYGSLQLTASIRADGSLEKIVIERSSGSKILDAAAEKIVRQGAPYAAFASDMREKADFLDITRTWTFTRSDQLSGGD